jgi:hypothetical protein
MLFNLGVRVKGTGSFEGSLKSPLASQRIAIPDIPGISAPGIVMVGDQRKVSFFASAPQRVRKSSVSPFLTSTPVSEVSRESAALRTRSRSSSVAQPPGINPQNDITPAAFHAKKSYLYFPSDDVRHIHNSLMSNEHYPSQEPSITGQAQSAPPSPQSNDQGAETSAQKTTSGMPNEIVGKAKYVAAETLKAGQGWAEKGIQAVGGMEGVKTKAANLKDDLSSGKFKRDVMAKDPEALKILAAIVGVFLFAVYLLFGSDSGYVSTVRDGIMESYSKSKTIGDALDKSGVISGGKWTSFKASTGERIVQFSGSIKGIEKTISKTLKEGEKEAKENGLGAVFELANPVLKMFDFIRVDSCNYTLQFAIDARDSRSFELKAAELNVKASPTGDAKEGIKKLLSEELSIVDGEADVLKAIYQADDSEAAIAVKGIVLKQVMTAGALMD